MGVNAYKFSHSIYKEKNYRLLNILLIGLCVLLFLRDVQGIAISKFILFAVVSVYILIATPNHFFVFLCFIMPIYVGLPGNYITVLILAKFIYLLLSRPKSFKLSPFLCLLTFGMSFFVLIQDYVLNYMSVYNLMPAVEIFIVLLMLSYKGDIDYKQCVYKYVLSVAFLGIVLLASNINLYGFSQLLDSATRLGTTITEEMSLRIDPNYYGYFTIAAVSCGWLLLLSNFSTFKKFITGLSMLASVLVAFIGLSRTFLIVLCIWLCFVCCSNWKNSKTYLIIGVSFAIMALVLSLNPEIFEALLGRFAEKDMIGGNGRIRLMRVWLQGLMETPTNLLFGQGLFKVNVHCMPLQYLTGTGLIGSLMMLIFSSIVIFNTHRKYYGVGFSAYMPMLFIFIISLTVPVGQSLTFMFPTIMALLTVRMCGENKKSLLRAK